MGLVATSRTSCLLCALLAIQEQIESSSGIHTAYPNGRRVRTGKAGACMLRVSCLFQREWNQGRPAHCPGLCCFLALLSGVSSNFPGHHCSPLRRNNIDWFSDYQWDQYRYLGTILWKSKESVCLGFIVCLFGFCFCLLFFFSTEYN